jgi:hypothetical protein
VTAALETAADDGATSALYRVYLVPDLDPTAMRFAGVVRLKSAAMRSLLGAAAYVERHERAGRIGCGR